jgi:hypothetical protein
LDLRAAIVGCGGGDLRWLVFDFFLVFPMIVCD